MEPLKIHDSPKRTHHDHLELVSVLQHPSVPTIHHKCIISTTGHSKVRSGILALNIGEGGGGGGRQVQQER